MAVRRLVTPFGAPSTFPDRVPALNALATGQPGTAMAPEQEGAHHPGHHAAHHPSHQGTHAHHADAHRPAPRPRPKGNAKPAKRRRRARGAGLGEEDDLEFPEEDDAAGVAPVTFQPRDSDARDDQDEGGDERKRHERHERVDHYLDDQADAQAGGAADANRLPKWHRGSDARLAVARHVAESCRLVAGWRPGDRVAEALLRKRLELVEKFGAMARLTEMSADELTEALIAHGPAGGANAMLNLMLFPWLLSLRRRRSSAQRAQSVAAMKARLRAAAPERTP